MSARARHRLGSTWRAILALSALGIGIGIGFNPAIAAPLPGSLLQTVRATGSVDVIVEFDASAIDRQSAQRRARLPRRTDDDAELSRRSTEYRSLKDRVMRPMQRADIDDTADYSHLPLSFKRVRSEAALRALAAHAGVKALHENRVYRRVLAQSLPLISQPIVSLAGFQGNGSTVAVIDDGVNLANAAFGGCTSAGVPAACRIAARTTYVDPSSQNRTPATNNDHGTNVAAIVLGVAPLSRLVSVNVFDTNGGALSSDILSAINWAITNRTTYNIVAMNLSLGDPTNRYPQTCGPTSSYTSAVANARAAGISVVVAAGNNAMVNGVYADGLTEPACVPGVLSVGAVYDSNLGGLAWGGTSANACTDLGTAADEVVCFSNGAGYLSLLAPGALITAGGITLGGTSQATPHVAGALAVLRSAVSSETRAQVEARLTTNGTTLVDGRSGTSRSTPRLNLQAAAPKPVNDAFASAMAISGSSGTAQAINLLATGEPGEPANGVTSHQSLWWRWTAPAAGQVTLDTSASNFDTRLEVYTGTSLANLVRIAANDNASASTTTSSLHFQAQAGVSYAIAVDTASGSGGNVGLAWGVNSAAAANLSVALSGPTSAPVGSSVTYTLTLSNAGPQSATGVIGSVAVPAGLSVQTVASGCAAQTSSVQCSAGELASGASASFPLTLLINSLSTPINLSANVASNLPDPTTSNNTVAATLSAPVGGGSVAAVPTLPEWAALLLGGLLLGTGSARRHSGLARTD
jgi:uncharacterized repeat protein (TIGR01451 family)